MKTDITPASVPVEGNAAVNKQILREVADLNAKLAAFGLQPSSGYSIAPALGGDVVKPPNTTTPSANLSCGSIAS